MATDKTVQMKNIVSGVSTEFDTPKVFFTLSEMEAYNADVGETLLLLGRETLFDGHVMYYVTQVEDPAPKKSEMLNNGLYAVEVPNNMAIQPMADGIAIKNTVSGQSLILKNDGSLVLPASNLNMPNKDVVLGMNEVYSKLYNAIGYKFDTHVFIQDVAPKKQGYVYLDKQTIALYLCIKEAPSTIQTPDKRYFTDISLRALSELVFQGHGDYASEYDETLDYAEGDVVYMTGHEPCYVFEATVNDNMSDPTHPIIFKKTYRIDNTMRYRRQNEKWEMIFDNEANLDFYTIPEKLPNQKYKSTVDNFYPWSEMKRVVMDGFVSMNEKYELSDTDSTQKKGGGAANLTTEGNVMVRLPKFYCEVKMTQNGRRYRIYDYKNPIGKIALGIKPHPVFWDNENGTQFAEKYYCSAFEGSIKDERLVSITGVNPQVSQNINWFINAAKTGRNSQWGIQHFFEIAAIQALFIVEFGSLNSQAILGQGRSNTSSLASTGRTLSLGNRSGRAGTDDANDFISYRGIENPFGNIWKFIAGLMLRDDGYYVSTIMNNITPNNMIHIPKTLNPKLADGYVDKMEVVDNYEFLLIPSSTAGSASTYYCDNFWSHDVGEENIALFGGDWDLGSDCGLFCLYCHNVASNVYVSIGSRLSLRV